MNINFYNTNIQNGVPIAIILQYGHGTRNGGWVEGRDYINPAIHKEVKVFEDENDNKMYISSVIREGYILSGKVIRPAEVSIIKPISNKQ